MVSSRTTIRMTIRTTIRFPSRITGWLLRFSPWKCMVLTVNRTAKLAERTRSLPASVESQHPTWPRSATPDPFLPRTRAPSEQHEAPRPSFEGGNVPPPRRVRALLIFIQPALSSAAACETWALTTRQRDELHL